MVLGNEVGVNTRVAIFTLFGTKAAKHYRKDQLCNVRKHKIQMRIDAWKGDRNMEINKLNPSDIREAIEQVVRESENYLSPYQILERLPISMKAELISHYGKPGRGAGHNFSGVSRISQMTRKLCDNGICEFIYINSDNLYFEVAGDHYQAGSPACACYRIRRDVKKVEEVGE